MKPIFIVIHAVMLLLILVVTLSPVIGVAVAGSIATANGCTLNEGQAHPCIVNGVDWGETLYALGVMGWFMLVTIPVGGSVLSLYVLVLAGYLVWKKLRQKAALPAEPRPS
jgi:hypothetical protein